VADLEAFPRAVRLAVLALLALVLATFAFVFVTGFFTA
jgi:hypothetical protein